MALVGLNVVQETFRGISPMEEPQLRAWSKRDIFSNILRYQFQWNSFMIRLTLCVTVLNKVHLSKTFLCKDTFSRYIFREKYLSHQLSNFANKLSKVIHAAHHVIYPIETQWTKDKVNILSWEWFNLSTVEVLSHVWHDDDIRLWSVRHKRYIRLEGQIK